MAAAGWRCFFGSPQQFYVKSNAGQEITPFHISALLSETYERAATVSSAISTFRSAGIKPVNRSVFNGIEFSAQNAINENFPTDSDVVHNENVPITKDTKVVPTISCKPHQQSNLKLVSLVSESCNQSIG